MELSCYLTVCIPLIKSSCGLTRGVLWFCGSTSSPQCLCPAHNVFFVSIANEKRAFLLLFEVFFFLYLCSLVFLCFFQGFFFFLQLLTKTFTCLRDSCPASTYFYSGSKKKKKDEWSDSSFHRTHHTTFFLPPCCVTLRRDSCTTFDKQRRKKWWSLMIVDGISCSYQTVSLLSRQMFSVCVHSLFSSVASLHLLALFLLQRLCVCLCCVCLCVLVCGSYSLWIILTHPHVIWPSTGQPQFCSPIFSSPFINHE